MRRHNTHKKIEKLAQTLLLAVLTFSTFVYVAGPALVTAESSPKARGSFTHPYFYAGPSFITAQSPSALAKGKFLVASRDLNDPNFSESVILLLDYNQQGALGVIINRPTEVPLIKLLPKVKSLQKRKDVAYVGGPVARHMLMMLTRSAKPPQDAQNVFSDIFLVSQQAGLEHLLRSGGTQAKLRAYVGYAGWASGQLEMEVSRGGWHIVPADADLIFDKAAMDIWPELIRRGEAQWTHNQHLESPFLLVRPFIP